MIGRRAASRSIDRTEFDETRAFVESLEQAGTWDTTALLPRPEVSLTTNAIGLARVAPALAAAGPGG